MKRIPKSINKINGSNTHNSYTDVIERDSFAIIANAIDRPIR